MESQQNGVRRTLAAERSQCGQILTMFLIFLIPLTIAGLSVYNVGMMTTEKMKIQNAADNAAYSAAVWNARYMNLTAYTTRAMVANYDTIAFITGLYSFFDALDGFLAQLQEAAFVLAQIPIPIVQQAFQALYAGVLAVHGGVHTARRGVAEIVHGNSSTMIRVNNILEQYTTQVLSPLQDLLYLVTQAGRAQLIREVAGGVDRTFRSWPGTEIFNIEELEDAVGASGLRATRTTDEDNGLRLTVEHSLNAFSNGGSIRDADNLLPGPLRALKDLIDFVNSFVVCGVDLDIGPHGFNGPGFNHVTGAESGAENLPSTSGFGFGGSAGPQRIVHNDKMYQLDESTISLDIGTGILCDVIPGLPIEVDVGHRSDDRFNTGLLRPHRFDSATGGSVDVQGMQAFGNDHPQDILDIDETNPDEATEYKFDDELKDVRITLFEHDSDQLDANDGDKLIGPRSFVYLRKSSRQLPLFAGLGLSEGVDVPGFMVQGNLREPLPRHTFQMEAYAMARTYFTQRRRGNRPAARFNRESMLNPFWAGRLERLSTGNQELLH